MTFKTNSDGKCTSYAIGCPKFNVAYKLKKKRNYLCLSIKCTFLNVEVNIVRLKVKNDVRILIAVS